MKTRLAPHEPEPTVETTRHPVWVPILEWHNPELLSAMVGDAVCEPAAFSTALRVMLQLGIPSERGAIGVKFPHADRDTLGERPDGTWLGQTTPEQSPALRAVVQATDLLEYPENYQSLLKSLEHAQWYGFEIRCDETHLPTNLPEISHAITAAGLHPALGLKLGALREENRQVIDSFPTVALDLPPLSQISSSSWRFLLGVHEVIALVVDASSNARTNLEKALASLITLRAALDVDTQLSVGIAGEFAAETPDCTLEPREPGLEILETGFKRKLEEILDLSTAFHYGKESVACAFAADAIARTAQLTAPCQEIE